MELEPLTISPPPLSVDWQYHLAFRRELLVRCPELPTPKYLLAPEIRALAALPINQHHRMLLLLLFNTGGRISEVLCLTPNDVLQHKGRTVIKMRTLKQQRSKQGRPKEGLVRLVTLYDDQFANILEGYIVTHCSNKKLPIFRTQQKNSQTGQRDRPVNSETARNWLKQIERIAHKNDLDVLIPLTPKVLRHSAAVHLILNRMPVKMVQKFLGHKSIQSTEVYTDLLAVDMSYDVQIKF